ncbi:hypothetical protein [Pedosphaera parvula]|uniref:Uncharacterized protein n=1 Tax=Pedosphaera parvula (strain Ellin514) TaxID=320771 RepID=B9XLE9_PEDPL|nr:hypothetical protein [Pedosphaera parvula]EEF59352.1 hypothetical protein Cflav_PD1900 [Pedosphaera parvula Ellin514]
MRTLLAFFFLLQVLTGHSQTTNTIRFKTIDIFLDSKDKSLAAYQLEFKSRTGNAKIVGVEGGEHEAFKEAPYYDAKAMQQERVIIAAFSTNAEGNLPKGKTRVATIHVQVIGDKDPDYSVELEAAADSQGKKISAETSFEQRKEK